MSKLLNDKTIRGILTVAWVVISAALPLTAEEGQKSSFLNFLHKILGK